MQESVDKGLSIPESDQEFVILPDKVKVRFESTGPLMKYLDEEMAAWRNVDYYIFAQYEQIKNALNQIVAHAGDGGLKQGVINQIRSALCASNLSNNPAYGAPFAERDEDGLAALGHRMRRVVEIQFFHFTPCLSGSCCGIILTVLAETPARAYHTPNWQ